MFVDSIYLHKYTIIYNMRTSFHEKNIVKGL